jgi:hypothetical protein
MPENPREKEDLEEKKEKSAKDAEKSSPGEDQKKRSYYYDDACGYEVYNANEDQEDEN